MNNNYPDLKTYVFGEGPAQKRVKLVGGLDKDQSFPTGTVPETILDRLWELCKQPMGPGLWKHAYQLCPTEATSVINYKGEQQEFGRWQIVLVCQEQTMYVAPHIIFHSIMVHHYLPPQEFLDAVLTMPLPTADNQAYMATLEPFHVYLSDIEALYVEIANNTPVVSV